MSPVQLGLILLCPAMIYMVATPIVGYLCDKVRNLGIQTKNFKKLIKSINFKYKRTMPWFMLLGTFGSGAAFTFFGPLSYYKLPLYLI